MKKLAVVVAISLCFGLSASAFDATYDINFDTGDITVKGQMEEAKANRMVSLEIKDKNNQTVFVDILDTDSNGSFLEVLGLPTNFASGPYTLLFGVYGKEQSHPLSMNYSSMLELQPIIQNANSINDSELMVPIVEDSISALSLPNGFYNDDKLSYTEKENVAAKLIAERPEGGYTTPTQIKNVLYQAIAEEVFTAADNAEEMKEAIEAFSSAYEITEENTALKLYAEFDKFSKDEKFGDAKILNVYKIMSDFSFENRFSGFDEAVFLTALSNINVKQPTDITSIIEKYGKLVDIDLTYYNLIETDYVALKLAGNSFDSIEKLEEKIKEIYDLNMEPDKTPISGVNGGSGNRGTTTAVIMPTVTTPIQQNDIKNEYAFNDIENVLWAKDSILELNKKGIVMGDGNGKFNPHNNVTRAEYILMLVRAFELFDDSSECNFSDVAKNHFAHRAIASAYKKGIVSGIDREFFAPEHKITRQDLAVMTVRAVETLGKEFKTENIHFYDEEKISEYAKDSVMKLVSEGIINGMGDNNFSPHENATRAQAAKILNGVLKMAGGQ